jgi:hypothetical protein
VFGANPITWYLSAIKVGEKEREKRGESEKERGEEGQGE